MFKCCTCLAVFEYPRINTEYVPTEHGYAPYKTIECPHCGGSFEEADLCRCGEYKFKDEKLCAHCREALLAKFVEFADGLTEEEEDQIDDWLDGRSIKERKMFV